MPKKALLVLDVDGTVLPLPPRRLGGSLGRTSAPPGYRDARAWGFDVRVPEVLQRALPRFAEAFELVWCSSWLGEANREVGPLFGLAELPVLVPAPEPRRGWWKLRAVAEYAASSPLVWADDEMNSTARRWATARPAPTLLIRPAPERGISTRQLVLIEHFAAQLT